LGFSVSVGVYLALAGSDLYSGGWAWFATPLLLLFDSPLLNFFGYSETTHYIVRIMGNLKKQLSKIETI